MALRVDAAGYTDKYTRRIGAATQDIQNGIKRVTVAPGQKAAQQANLMLAKLTASVTSGQWANAVSRVSVTDWQNAALNKGVPRILPGVQAAQGKIQLMAGKLLAAVAQAQAAVEATPRGDLNTNIQRMVTFATTMSQLAPKRQK